MTEVVALIDGEHGAALRRTFRESFHCSIDQIGGQVSWADALALIESSAKDMSTAFGAELAGWGYQASLVDVAAMLSTAASGGRKMVRAIEGLTPWAVGEKQRSEVRYTQEEVAAATDEMWDDVVFSG